MSTADREAQERKVAKARFGAPYRAQAQVEVDALLVQWGDTLPESYLTEIERAVKSIISEEDCIAGNALLLGCSTAYMVYEPILDALWPRWFGQEHAAAKLLAARYADRATVKMLVRREQETVGVLSIVGERVLVCVKSSHSDGHYTDDRDGWFTDYAECNTDEQAMPEYTHLAQYIADERAAAVRERAEHDARREAELAAITSAGREPTFSEMLTAGDLPSYDD